MSVERARVIKAGQNANANANAGANASTSARADASTRTETARRIPRVVVDAHLIAGNLVADAQAKAAAIVAEATANATTIAEQVARETREKEIARVAAEVIAVRAGAERRAEKELDRTIELAVLLAERLVGEAIAVEPARIAALANGALKETRGARQMRIEAAAGDVAALEEVLATLGEGVATIEVSPELARGSLVVHTELGRVDARLAPQLGRLAEALREVLRGNLRG
ncbi:MAG: Flagellar assembly protein FliH [Myxococcaceae bacterium]|nr:Flagellar assembly protein FliH [Myxococcaceae bacterium]